MANDTMKAARVHAYGGGDQIVVEDTPRPTAGAGQVVVRLHAVGVNPADWKIRNGWFQQYIPTQFPWIPGIEGAGIVEAMGADVTSFRPGQAVFGFVPNSYAEYGVAAANELQPKPDALSFEQAASVPLGSLTAWEAIEVADLKPGQRVLIHGGAGGVGLYAVQLAKAKGAYVIATASGGNADYVRSLGADEVIDYTKTKFEDAAKDVDAVIDTVGGDLIPRSIPIIKAGGIFVTVAGMVDPESGTAHDVRVTSASRASADKLANVADLIKANKLKTQVGTVLPLADARKAHESSETGHGRGRIVLKTA